MIVESKRETAFVAVENQGKPIFGGFRLYVVHKKRREHWFMTSLLSESDIENLQGGTLVHLYIIRYDPHSIKGQWLYSKYPVEEDTSGIFQRFATVDKAIDFIRNTLL